MAEMTAEDHNIICELKLSARPDQFELLRHVLGIIEQQAARIEREKIEAQKTEKFYQGVNVGLCEEHFTIIKQQAKIIKNAIEYIQDQNGDCPMNAGCNCMEDEYCTGPCPLDFNDEQLAKCWERFLSEREA